MIRLTLAIVACIVLAVVFTLGYRGMSSDRPPLQPFNDMVFQPKYKTQSQSEFFADSRTMRMPPAHVVPWGPSPRQADAAAVATDEAAFALTTLPLPLDRALLLKGQKLYATNCLMCHGGAGEGNGITTVYGMINPPSYHTERLQKLRDGEIYQVITMGKGQMGPQAERVKPDERWAIVAYLRALQRAHSATIDDVPEAARRELMP